MIALFYEPGVCAARCAEELTGNHGLQTAFSVKNLDETLRSSTFQLSLRSSPSSTAAFQDGHLPHLEAREGQEDQARVGSFRCPWWSLCGCVKSPAEFSSGLGGWPHPPASCRVLSQIRRCQQVVLGNQL